MEAHFIHYGVWEEIFTGCPNGGFFFWIYDFFHFFHLLLKCWYLLIFFSFRLTSSLKGVYQNFQLKIQHFLKNNFVTCSEGIFSNSQPPLEPCSDLTNQHTEIIRRVGQNLCSECPALILLIRRNYDRILRNY